MADRTMYEAITDFSTDIDGVPTNVSKGERADAGHVLVKSCPQNFAAVTVKYAVEEASAAPGEQRGAPGPTVVTAKTREADTKADTKPTKPEAKATK